MPKYTQLILKYIAHFLATHWNAVGFALSLSLSLSLSPMSLIPPARPPPTPPQTDYHEITQVFLPRVLQSVRMRTISLDSWKIPSLSQDYDARVNQHSSVKTRNRSRSQMGPTTQQPKTYGDDDDSVTDQGRDSPNWQWVNCCPFFFNCTHSFE
jgi:hypothetical protein